MGSLLMRRMTKERKEALFKEMRIMEEQSKVKMRGIRQEILSECRKCITQEDVEHQIEKHVDALMEKYAGQLRDQMKRLQQQK